MAGSQTAASPNGSQMAPTQAQPPPTVPANGSADPAANANSITSPDGSGLTTDEIALYDRQIRLWGAQAQERIRSAHILLISLRALGTEIAKNLVLAGVASLTIVDGEGVSEEDLGCGFFFREEDAGAGKSRAEAAIPRLQEMNPRVTVTSDGDLNSLLLKDQTYYAPFACIIACDHDFLTLSMINTAARVAQRPFYAAGIHGMYGFIFADLFGHEFVVEREKSNIPTQPGMETITRAVLEVTTKEQQGSTGGAANGTTAVTKAAAGAKEIELVKKQELYCPLILANSSPLPMDVLNNRRKLKAVPALLPCLRALFDFQRTQMRLPQKNSHEDLQLFTTLATSKSRELMLPPETLQAGFLRSFLQNLGAEIMPVAAFVGGRVAEDVINVLSRREQPIQNFALFDGEALDGRIYCLFTMPPELSLGMGMDVGGGMGMVDGGGMGMGMDGAGMGMDGGLNEMNGFGAMDGMNGLGGMNGMGADFGMGMGMDNAGMPGMGMDFIDANGMAGAGIADMTGMGGDASLGGMGMNMPIQQPEQQQQSVSGATEEAMAVETSAAPDTVDTAATATNDDTAKTDAAAAETSMAAVAEGKDDAD